MGAERLTAALSRLREALAGVRLPLDLPSSALAQALVRGAVDQLDDYILPRLDRLDAPLLAVVGGSTGAGKSTLVNSLLGRVVSNPGVIRPTTRSPVLVHHPDDAAVVLLGIDAPRSRPQHQLGQRRPHAADGA